MSLAGLFQLISSQGSASSSMHGSENTLFLCGLRKVTRFGQQLVGVTDYSGSNTNEGELTWTIPRSGDIITEAFFSMVVPGLYQEDDDNTQEIVTIEEAARVGVTATAETDAKPCAAHYTQGLGYALIKSATLTIGGSEVCKSYSEMAKVWSELTGHPGRKLVHDEMTMSFEDRALQIKHSRVARRIVVPLSALSFLSGTACKGLPIIALPFHTVKIKIDVRRVAECIVAPSLAADANAWTGAFIGTTPTTHVRLSQTKEDYGNSRLVILGTTGTAKGTTITTSTTNSSICSSPILSVRYILLDREERAAMSQLKRKYVISQYQKQRLNALGTGSYKDSLTLAHPVSTFVFMVRRKVNSDRRDHFNFFGQYDVDNKLHDECIKDYQLYLNNSSAFACQGEGQQDTIWARAVEPHSFHTAAPNNGVQSKGVYIYSPSLAPENVIQPHGSLNFSKIDSVSLQMTPKTDYFKDSNASAVTADNGFNTAEVLAFARSYNTLSIESGLAGLEWSL